MNMDNNNRFPGPVNVFLDRRLPVKAVPAGYAALAGAYALRAPLPRTLSAAGERRGTLEEDGWRIHSSLRAPAATLESHLTFALKYEGLDLALLKRLFLAAGPSPVERMVRSKPTGGYARRAWFLYEWLTGKRLSLPNATAGTYVEVVNPALQYAVPGSTSSRHRVRDNLPGTPDFCPLVFRTEKLERLTALDLRTLARETAAAVPRDLLARTAAFLLFQDSRSSFIIEGERPPQNRIQRWGAAIGEAGRRPVDLEELVRLQRIIIGDARFVRAGLRAEGGFVGERDRRTQMPIPVHVSAPHGDLGVLVGGMAAFADGSARELDPVLAASVLAFGFVYVHPFEDGNGRLHRYLIHHVLAQSGFNPPGAFFPVSAAILERVEDYRAALEDYSRRLLPCVDWEATERGNVRVMNDTADFYRFFDATAQTEFLYECVRQTIERDMPREAEFLRRYDAFRADLNFVVDMPDRLSDRLFRFLRQNDGRLPKRRREKEFSALTDAEVARIEEIFEESFSGFEYA